MVLLRGERLAPSKVVGLAASAPLGYAVWPEDLSEVDEPITG